MEEIFANQGLQHIAEKICLFLSPSSFQKLILTSKFMMSYSANNFQEWFLKCQKAQIFSEMILLRWEMFVNYVQKRENDEMDWILGIIFKFLYHKRYSESSEIYDELIQIPHKTVAFLGHIQLLNLAIRRVSDIRFDSIEIKNEVTDWIAIPIRWKDGKTETFKAFKSVLQHIIESDDSLFDRLVEIARSSGSTEIQKISMNSLGFVF